MKYLKLLLPALITFCLTTAFTSPFNGGVTEATDEYKVKLALIEKFTLYIDWPTQSRVHKADQPFVFGVFGDVHPFGEDLAKLKNERQLKWKKVDIRFYESNDDFGATYPDLLFVPRDYNKDLSAITEALKDKPVLVVAEDRGLVEQGVGMDIFIEEGKAKFELNHDALRKKGFRIGDDLVKLSAQN